MSETIAAAFGWNVQNERASCGVIQTDLAKLAGISKGHLSQIERGQREPRLGTAVRIAAALGCPLTDLLPPPDADACTHVGGIRLNLPGNTVYCERCGTIFVPRDGKVRGAVLP